MATKHQKRERDVARVVFITGVAGGIGSATAKIFAENGWQVTGTDLKPLPEELKSSVHLFFQEDLTIDGVAERVMAEIKQKEGRLDAIVNNAALQICKLLVDTTADDFDRVIGANLKAVFMCMKYAHPLLAASGAGAVVNVSSVHAVATSRSISAYAASKGALSALTRAASLEFADDNIRVNAVLPGAVDTPMLHSGLSRGHVEGTNVLELVRGLGKKHVMGRVGQPEEIGEAILFLADSDRSSFVTGQSITIDGGATARLSTE
eukprot:TRINITY_DN2245_c0_g1_i4.p1 TRINITY_DN2245_c0_g1~~TRINITY_DN2245_c0_g1_i4.p1  ORF type:complete len:264 (-),score=117.17 TRINITY_DN2245_c0_g1_i4:122-913(-)